MSIIFDYAPAQPKVIPEALEELSERRSRFVRGKTHLKCPECGGYIVGLLPGESYVEGHGLAQREGKIVGACQRAIISEEGVGASA